MQLPGQDVTGAANLYPAKWPTSNDGLAALWQGRITHGLRDRRRYEPQWHQNQAFAAGKQWLQWSTRERRLILPAMPDGRERYTADVLTQYMWTAMGKIMADDFRPELLFRRDDIESEEFAKQANQALSYGWEHEWDGDKILTQLLIKILTYGTCAVRCRFDPTIGPIVAENVPFENGQPILDPQAAIAAVSEAAINGSTLQFKDIRGRVVWEPLTPFNLIVPPGLDHEDDFPWEIVERPRTVDSLRREFGAKAASLTEESMSAVDLLGVRDTPMSDDQDSSTGGRLEGHIKVYTCYQRPTIDLPQGHTTVIAGRKVLDQRPELPYQAPDGEPRSGITYFHYWRVPSRFWSKSLIEPGIGPQRALNKRRSQMHEIIDRGLPFVFAEEGSLKQPPQGKPMAIVTLKPGAPRPEFNPGMGPGSWMEQDVASIYVDLEKALGMRDISLGAHPQGVSAYAALALMGENDQTKMDPIVQGFKLSVRRIVENTLWDVRRYWPPDKQIALAGNDGLLDAVTFNASKLPDFFQVEIAKGASKPRSQGAQIQMIYDLFQQGAATGQPLTIDWLYESLQAGKPQPLPDEPMNVHRKKAEVENQEMMAGQQIGVAYYDPPEVHIPIHRDQQVQAELTGNLQSAQLIEAHIRMHLQAQAMVAQEQAQAASPTGPLPPGPGQPPGLNYQVERQIQHAGSVAPKAGVSIP